MANAELPNNAEPTTRTRANSNMLPCGLVGACPWVRLCVCASVRLCRCVSVPLCVSIVCGALCASIGRRAHPSYAVRINCARAYQLCVVLRSHLCVSFMFVRRRPLSSSGIGADFQSIMASWNSAVRAPERGIHAMRECLWPQSQTQCAKSGRKTWGCPQSPQCRSRAFGEHHADTPPAYIADIRTRWSQRFFRAQTRLSNRKRVAFHT